MLLSRKQKPWWLCVLPASIHMAWEKGACFSSCPLAPVRDFKVGQGTALWNGVQGGSVDCPMRGEMQDAQSWPSDPGGMEKTPSLSPCSAFIFVPLRAQCLGESRASWGTDDIQLIRLM